MFDIDNENEIDNRKIVIHEYSYGPSFDRELQMTDTTIWMYYVSNNFLEKLRNLYRSNERIEKFGYSKEGYIIEAKIKAVQKSLIKYIDNEYFNKIYIELENLDFKKIVNDGIAGCDGGGLDIEMSINKRLISYVNKITLWSPNEENNEPNLSKLMDIIKNVKNKINFDQWYNTKYEEWEKWEEQIIKYNEIFYYSKDES